MASIFNMYKDVASPDMYQATRQSRQDSEANTKRTLDTAFNALRKSNIGSLQQDYRAGAGRFADIVDPDKKFQVYYDALKALDPQAAEDASKVYGEERQRRINREVADAYKAETTTGNPDLDKLDQVIADLSAAITAEEANQAQQAAQQEAQQEAEQSVDTTQAEEISFGYNPSIDTGRTNQPIDTELGYTEGELQADWSKLGAMNLPRYDLRRMYGINPNFDISGRRVETDVQRDPGAEIRQMSTPTTGMEGYLPANRFDGYKPMVGTIANMYRGR